MKLLNGSRWADQLVHEGIISAEDSPLYAYGFKQGLMLLLNIATTFIIGALMDSLWPALIFFLCYPPLRSMAGGYHARTQIRCYLLGIGLTVIVFAMIQWIPWTPISIVLITAVASLIIWSLAPVADTNKPLDELEITVYRKRARRILMVQWLVLAIALAMQWAIIANSIGVSILAVSGMLVIGKKKF